MSTKMKRGITCRAEIFASREGANLRHQLSNPPPCCAAGFAPMQTTRLAIAAGASHILGSPSFVIFSAYLTCGIGPDDKDYAPELEAQLLRGDVTVQKAPEVQRNVTSGQGTIALSISSNE